MEYSLAVLVKMKPGRCQIARVETTLSITYTMPKLISSNPDVKRVFNRWYRRLDLHEKGHAKLAKNAATKIDRLILAMSPRKSFKQLGKEANELGHVILNQLKMENKVYDKRTQHGCTQGGCLGSYL
ncbi:hypothetical protein CS022_24075 [Veronia nyctiphanis]|uniref:DUF922 domain-containing protein n=1 Tax=Veronia nyctiphanis TaxID=1278244 RepID=A0A4Q0YDZ9_9GAMM|nr:DUF922 domain-containing protein [Veronia nyctiphanis]RXJ68707.1 hypothetical protein CS022_24075 [Veronia nyctiphanis]